MPLYEIKDGKLKPIREEDFKLEISFMDTH